MSNGRGYGNGNGSGNGYGDGYGYGNGNGYGDGVKNINGQAIYLIDSIMTIITAVYGNTAKGYILQDDFQLIPCYIVKGGGKFAHGESLKDAMSALEDKIYEDMNTDEVISEFISVFSEDKKYPAKDLYIWHHRLTGSCEMGRKQFAKERNIDIENDMFTVTEFIQLTKNSYGRSVIAELEERLRWQRCANTAIKKIKEKENVHA